LLAIWICWSGFLVLAQIPAKGFRWDWHTVETGRPPEGIDEPKTLSAKDRAGLTAAVTSSVDIKLGFDSEQGLQEAAARTQIEAIDLGGGAVGEFLALADGSTRPRLCSPTGNCEAWVFRQNGDSYSLILHRTATQTFTIQPTLTNGFHGLALGQHGSATDIV
jgi:hypothetical protein